MRYVLSHMKIANITLILSVLILVLNVSMINVSKEQASTQVSVKPADQTVGQTDVLLPTSPFIVNITVENVVNMYGWQVVLYYNSTLLLTESDNITLPSGHVFDGKPLVNPEPFMDSDSKGTYIFFGATLQAIQSGFTGSGLLFQIIFVGQAKGVSLLELDLTTDPRPGQLEGYSTELIDSTLVEIPLSIVNGKVTVVGIEKLKEPTEISININPASVTLGSNVSISGDINVTRSGLRVKIFYREVGSETWFELETISTDSNGHYIYLWNTTDLEVKSYELKASWQGNADYEGAESNVGTVAVNKRPSTISIFVSSANVTTGSTIKLDGTINPSPVGFEFHDVTISHRIAEETWTTLTTVKPNIDGGYTYSWKTTEPGSFELKASWQGDSKTLGAESDVKTVQITGEAPPPEEPLDIMAYVPYIAAVVIVVALIVFYFMRIRKS